MYLNIFHDVYLLNIDKTRLVHASSLPSPGAHYCGMKSTDVIFTLGTSQHGEVQVTTAIVLTPS